MTITFPESFFLFTGSDPQESAEGCIELGSEYCTDVRVVEGCMMLEVTQKQRDNLLEQGNDFMETLMAPFYNADPSYSFQGSEDYTEISFYYDEKLPSAVQLQAITGSVSGYAYNYILLNNTGDWSVHLKIYNCHTKNLVVDVELPKDKLSLGDKDWEKSYVE